MAWDIRKTYFYLVCFATLLMLIIGSVQVVQNTLDLVLPEEPYRPSPMEMYQRPHPDGAEAPFTREEVVQMVEEQAASEARRMRRNALRNLLGSLAMIGIAAPVYLYHWRQVRQIAPGE